jgi:S-adenosyl-L-methionine hydrolase (adenosine-forming)
VSDVFHGRDIMGPVAGMIAAGVKVSEVAREIGDPVLLDLWPAASGDRGVVIHVDGFGNAMTNIPAEAVDRRRVREVRVKGRSVGPLRRRYADVAVGEALALIGSSGLVEIAVREGSAAERLGVAIGDWVKILGL